ncbi:hypothetical protein AAG906_030504 [Vitis piasezkii]
MADTRHVWLMDLPLYSLQNHETPSLRRLPSAVTSTLSLEEDFCKAMASSWRRSLGNMRSFIGNCMGGLRGGSNLASWVVAGTLAYFLWVKPSQELRREQEERAALAAASDPYRYVEKRKPIPDPQETGLIYGNKNRTNKSQD